MKADVNLLYLYKNRFLLEKFNWIVIQYHTVKVTQFFQSIGFFSVCKCSKPMRVSEAREQTEGNMIGAHNLSLKARSSVVFLWKSLKKKGKQ